MVNTGYYVSWKATEDTAKAQAIADFILFRAGPVGTQIIFDLGNLPASNFRIPKGVTLPALQQQMIDCLSDDVVGVD